MTDPSKYLFWITARAAGTTAMVLASAALAVGLAIGTRVIKGQDLRNIHQTLALATLVALVIHGLSLIADSYLHASALDVTVPFVFSYKTITTSIGIISGWGLMILGLSYYARTRIGYRRWKLIHRFTALAWLGGLIHAFTEGTDAGQLWFIALISLTAAPACALLAIRLAGGPRRRLIPVAAGR